MKLKWWLSRRKDETQSQYRYVTARFLFADVFSIILIRMFDKDAKYNSFWLSLRTS